ncbi:efflux RND transporter periplasmic adaptor subunit [Paenibacillus piri]|uniref:Efflux RND transporter periplasmic adaptor subunit n=1 Tax=Paenibacillus piri TaxID=2547395 RepID=A0A4V2ZUB5_9BACL|nr:efflux RND transporter periplasmic adaptor subunit [Paenibacillus piri]TDG00305.1 efflux RND transporter periplasmic adaptor subunit [Paenibacillus piri]
MRKARLRQHSLTRTMVSATGILTLSAALIAGCSQMNVLLQNPVESSQEQQAKAIKTEKISKQKIGDPLEQAAEVMSSVQINVNAKAGGDIEQIVKKRGDVVQEGEVIVKLNSSELKVQREKALLNLKSAQEALDRGKREQERARKDYDKQVGDMRNSITKLEQTVADLQKAHNKVRNDYDHGLATKLQVYQSQTQLKNAELDLQLLKQQQKTMGPANTSPVSDNELNNAQISLQQADEALASLEVKAPVSGMLTELPIQMGMTLAAGAPVGLIEKLNPVKIKGFLPVEAAKFVRGKSELAFFLPESSQKSKGKISYLASVIDPQAKAYEINLEAPNPDMALKPGMKVRMQLTDEQEQIVVAIPTQSIIKEGDVFYVFVLNGDIAEKRRVELGRLNEPIQEVLSGVKEGEQLVVSGQNQLKPNEKVTPPAGGGSK